MIFKYRMLVQVRTDLTADEIEKHLASKGPRTTGAPPLWPYRDTGEILHARRAQAACAFYRALKQIKPLIKIRAVKINEPRSKRRDDDIQLRAWRGFACLCGSINGVEDEVKHFEVANGITACGLNFTTHHVVHGKPECETCLAVAVNCHTEMKEFL